MVKASRIKHKKLQRRFRYAQTLASAPFTLQVITMKLSLT